MTTGRMVIAQCLRCQETKPGSAPRGALGRPADLSSASTASAPATLQSRRRKSRPAAAPDSAADGTGLSMLVLESEGAATNAER
jgi:hypothetical protein